MALTDKLTAIADSIRAKSGKTEKLTLAQMPVEIANIKTGTELNFSVVGNPKPANPTENTIWLDTDADITGWDISPVQPEILPEGMVWISTGAESEITFNALKENAIQVMPLSAMQCIGGALVDKPAQIYQNGEWKDWTDWSKWVVKDGLYKVPMVATGKKWDSSFSETTFTVTEEDGYIVFNHGSYTGMVYWGKVDLTKANTLTIEGDFSGMSSSYLSDYQFMVWTEIGAYIPTNRVAFKQLTSTGATLDVSSLVGEYYVGFSVRNRGTEKVANLWME